MRIEILNGAAVSRFYSDGDGELLAVFQYSTDADMWAEDKVAYDAKQGMQTHLIRTCLYSGKSRAFHPKPAA